MDWLKSKAAAFFGESSNQVGAKRRRGEESDKEEVVGGFRNYPSKNPGAATPDTAKKKKGRTEEGEDDTERSRVSMVSMLVPMIKEAKRKADKKREKAGSKNKEEEGDDFHSCPSEMEEEEEAEEEEEEEEEEEPTVRGSIKKLSRFIERGGQNVLDQSERKRNVVVVGLTGSGKSTLINSMAGCTMARISPAKAAEKKLPRDAIVVRGKARSKIGNTRKSETRLVQSIPVEGEGDTMLWDAPGFEDSHGEEQNIANAVNLQRLLEASSRSDLHGLIILVVLDAPSLDTGRGGQVKRTLEVLLDLFGGQQHDGKTAFQKHLSSIVFVLTKTSKVDAHMDTMKQWVIDLANDAGIALDGCLDKIVPYDPLCQDGSHKMQLKSLLAAAKPIERGQRFCTTLNAKDEKMLDEIVMECSSSIKQCMSKADGDGANRDWELLEALHVVDHTLITKCVQEVRDMVVDLAQSWKVKVRVLHTDMSAERRKEVKGVLALLKTNLPFVLQVGQVDLAMEHNELREEVKNQEATHQDHENSALRQRFSLLQEAVVDVLVKRADDAISSETKEKPKLALQEIKEGRDVIAFWDGLEKKAEERRLYVYGDQHNIMDLTNGHRAEMDEFLKRITHEWQINSDARKHAGRLEEHIGHATDAKFADLCQIQLAVDDLCTLIDLGFNKIDSDVRKVNALVKESVALLSDGKAMLRSTGKVESVVNKFLSSLKQQAIHKQSDWKRCVDELVSQINTILHAEQYERDSEELAKALDGLKQRNASEYPSMIDQIQKKASKYQSKGELATLAEAQNYSEIVKRYHTLKTLKLALAAHMPDLDSSSMHTFASEHVQKLGSEVELEINRGDPKDPRYLECSGLRKLTAILQTLREAFGEEADAMEEGLKKRGNEKLKQVVLQVKQETERVGRELMTAESQERISKMLVKGYSIAIELSMQSGFKSQIQDVIKGLDAEDVGLFVIGTSLERMTMGGDEASEIARTIIAEFPEFANFNTKLFNRKAGGVSFESALSMLESKPDNQNRAVLQNVFERYKSTYDEESRKIAKSVVNYPITETKQRFERIASNLRQHAVTGCGRTGGSRAPTCEVQLSKSSEAFGELVGLVSASWTFLSCKGKPGSEEDQTHPHATQILAICRLLSLDQDKMRNHLIQIGTGEGKSVALGITAVILAALGLSVDVVCYSSYLCDRDYKEFSPLFELFGLQDHIRYENFSSLSSKIMEEGSVYLPEVRGTFKRFLKGGSKKRQAETDADDGCQANPGPEADFTDHYEVLGLSFGASPSVIKKAYQKFAKQYHPDKTGSDPVKTQKFIEIKESYQALSDQEVKKAFDAVYQAKTPFKDKVRKKDTQRETSAVVVIDDHNDVYTTMLRKYEIELARIRPRKTREPPRPSILLVDEVDVFFGDGFYGQPYQPSVNVDTDDGDGYQLLLHIWQNRGNYCRGGKRSFDEALKQRQEVKKLCKEFPNLAGEILKREILKMFEAARHFPQGTVPTLSTDKQDYEVVDEVVKHKKTQRKIVRYVDPISRVPDESISYGYVTAFTYFYCKDSGLLTEEDVQAKVKLQPVCGTLSYSEIPKFYQCCLGMTGTLRWLTVDQGKLLSEYGFEQHTYLPSTFDKQKLNSKQTEEHTKTLVIHGSEDEYFEAIVLDIERELHAGRATLIVFAETKKMTEFSAKLNRRRPNHPKYDSALELKDDLDYDQRGTIVLQAIRRHKVTLMTRAYGRGTDFVCRDDGLVENGGVHVIMTFLPEDESENKQIEGRTCRQDNPGSSRKILFAKDLEQELGVQKIENVFMSSDYEDWDEFLLQHRSEHQERKYADMKERHDETMCKHKVTIEACNAVKDCKWMAAADLFFRAADVTRVAQQAVTCVEVCFVMDCTGSMAGSIKACQEKVIKIASNIQEHCAQNMRIRMAFIAYRDYTGGSNLQYDAPGAPEVFAFTEDIDRLRSFVSKQAAIGGGDSPEDICGGLRDALKLDWQGESRHLFLIADAPCHGSKYHDQADHFPDGDPTKLVPETQFEELMEVRQVNCKFLKLNAYTDKMMVVINSHCKTSIGKEVSEISLQDGGDSLAKELENAVTSSVVEDLKMHFC